MWGNKWSINVKAKITEGSAGLKEQKTKVINMF